MQFSESALQQLFKFEVLSDFQDNPEAMVTLAQILEDKSFPARQVILGEADSATRMFFLYEGEASVNKVSDNGQVVRIAKLSGRQFPFFGEAAILGFQSRSAQVVADTICKAYALSKEDFDLFSKDHPLAAMLFYKKLAQGLFRRIQKVDKDLLILGS